jgi:hypothetical protein
LDRPTHQRVDHPDTVTEPEPSFLETLAARLASSRGTPHWEYPSTAADRRCGSMYSGTGAERPAWAAQEATPSPLQGCRRLSEDLDAAVPSEEGGGLAAAGGTDMSGEQEQRSPHGGIAREVERVLGTARGHRQRHTAVLYDNPGQQGSERAKRDADSPVRMANSESKQGRPPSPASDLRGKHSGIGRGRLSQEYLSTPTALVEPPDRKGSPDMNVHCNPLYGKQGSGVTDRQPKQVETAAGPISAQLSASAGQVLERVQALLTAEMRCSGDGAKSKAMQGGGTPNNGPQQTVIPIGMQSTE